MFMCGSAIIFLRYQNEYTIQLLVMSLSDLFLAPSMDVREFEDNWLIIDFAGVYLNDTSVYT